MRHIHTIISNPGINDVLPVRRWPIENYARLIKNLLEDKAVFIVLVGTSARSSYGERILGDIIGQRVINLIGKTDIEELLALCAISRLMISHDGGIVHLASLTKIPIIVLFGPEPPCFTHR